MYTSENYLWGLVAYYLGTVLMLLCCWYYRRLIPWTHLRNLLFLFVTVILLLPFTAYPDLDYLAPAWLVSLFEGLTNSSEAGYLRAGVPLIVASVIAVLLYITIAIWLYFRFRKAAAVASVKERGFAEQGSVEQDSIEQDLVETKAEPVFSNQATNEPAVSGTAEATKQNPPD